MPKDKLEGVNKRYFNSWQGAVNWMTDHHGEDYNILQVCVWTSEDGLTDEEVASRIDAVEWTGTDHAGEYHEYITNDQDQDLYWEMVERIRSDGTARKWNGNVRDYYDFGDYRYWIMGGKPYIVLNRQLISESTTKPTDHTPNHRLDEY